MAAPPLDPPPALLEGLRRVALRDALLIADLHLNAGQPATLARFLRFCTEEATAHAELVILGDLFEYWVGDDTLGDPADHVSRTVAAALHRLTECGRRLYVMHGNRDLLLGAGFLRATGAQLLADPTVAETGDGSLLLAHGDVYCTRDVEYQRFRASVRQEARQREFLAAPLARRQAFMGAARAQSEAGKQTKAMEIMDVTPAAIAEALRAAGLRSMIHGHTHRPSTHRFTLAGAAAERWVLPDWDFDASPARGGAIALRRGQLTNVPLSA